MGKTKVIQLSDAQRQELIDGYRSGKSHAFRQCCQMILLKSEKRTSREIARLLGCHKITVNGWVKRFEAEGTEGIKNASGARKAGNSERGNRFESCAGGGDSFPSAHRSGAHRTRSRAAKPLFDPDAQKILKKTIAASNELESD